MKPVAEMSQIELTAFVQSFLETEKIHVVLSGGAATGFYSQNIYISADIDLVDEYLVDRKRIEKAMNKLGFIEKGRYFVHPDSGHIIEFPPGPLTVGLEPVRDVVQINLDTGLLRIISATDCVKDRLAAFYHWNDQQCLFQARLVTKHADVNLAEVERWSDKEGKHSEFIRFISEE